MSNPQPIAIASAATSDYRYRPDDDTMEGIYPAGVMSPPVQIPRRNNNFPDPSSLSPEVSVSYTPRRKLARRRRNAASCCRTFYDVYEYECEPPLGEGAYATVRAARHKTTGKLYAVKEINRDDPSHTRDKCMNELVLLKKCQGHENILQMHEYFEDRKSFYVIFEYIKGGDLQQHLDEQPESRFEEPVVNKIAACLANGLAVLHEKRIAHRDLKPANILCDYAEHAYPCKIADFDLATSETEKSDQFDAGICMTPPNCMGSSYPYSSYQEQERTYNMSMQSPVGSPEYMAPEIATKFMYETEQVMNMKYTQACDVWSLGIIIYRCLAGYAPFSAAGCGSESCEWNEGASCPYCQDSLFENINSGVLRFDDKTWDSISPEAKDFIEQCLNRDPESRITAAEMLNHKFITRLNSLEQANIQQEDASSAELGNTKQLSTSNGSISDEDAYGNVSNESHSSDFDDHSAVDQKITINPHVEFSDLYRENYDYRLMTGGMGRLTLHCDGQKDPRIVPKEDMEDTDSALADLHHDFTSYHQQNFTYTHPYLAQYNNCIVPWGQQEFQYQHT